MFHATMSSRFSTGIAGAAAQSFHCRTNESSPFVVERQFAPLLSFAFAIDVDVVIATERPDARGCPWTAVFAVRLLP
jgi:hypothetical protein